MRRLHGIALAAAALAAALLLAACGNQKTTSPAPETVVGSVPQETGPVIEVPEGDPAAGEQVYNSAGCGGCHVLAAAGSSGTVGPNLDESQPAPELVFDRVTNGRGGMPPFGGQLSEQQLADVTAYVVQATSG